MRRMRYWYCVIGPADQDELPEGADSPMRSAVEEAFEGLAGKGADYCSSGWGIDEELKEKLVTCVSERHAEEWRAKMTRGTERSR